jgi:hypothetical protein
LHALGFALYVPEMDCSDPTGATPLLDGLREFREHLGGELTIMLLEGIGRGVERHEMDAATIIRSIELLRNATTGYPLTNNVLKLSDGEEPWKNNVAVRLQ